MSSISYLKQITQNENWKMFLNDSDFLEMIEEIEQLRAREKTRLHEAVKEWKDRVGRLDMMAGEIAKTPGAEHLVVPVNAAVVAIDQLVAAMNQTLRD